MKLYLSILICLFFNAELVKASTCKSFLKDKSIPFGANQDADFLEISGADFIYLTTLLQTQIYDPKIDLVDHLEHRFKALNIESLLGVQVSPFEVRKIFIELLRFGYKSLSKEELRVGRKAFWGHKPLDNQELLARSLIEFTLAEQGAGLRSRIDTIIKKMRKVSSPVLMWHKAEMYARAGQFESAQRLLVRIVSNNPDAPLKVSAALRLTRKTNLPESVLDLLDKNKKAVEKLHFDYSDWGLYE